ncbi:MAG TPA: hypothetical protein VF668_15415 [Pyrinomonadaceae bacterium]
MSMEHKAFVFDYDSFTNELARLLRHSLESGHTGGLVDFVEAQRESLTDPYEGEPLDDDWRDMVETGDAHTYGDFALTKYYDPAEDLGLGYDWEEAETLLDGELGAGAPLVLGSPFGPEGDPFDPGKMGSYFRSPAEVREHLARLERLSSEKPELAEKLRPLSETLRRAADAGRGLYVTF